MRKQPVKRLFLGIAVLIALLLVVQGALAEFKGESDWVDHKRKLKYKFSSTVTKQWKEWIKEAIDNWNAVKGETGWEFEEAASDETEDIEFKLENIPAKERSGGANVTGFADPPIKKLTITIDSDIRDEEVLGKKPEGGENGWAKSGDKTLDPVLVIKHELTHTMRLDHGKGEDTGNLEDPINVGNHDNPKDRKPSANDKSEAKKAACVKKDNASTGSIGPSGGVHCHEGTSVIVPTGATVIEVDYTIRPISRTRTPRPARIESDEPSDVVGIILAVALTSDPGTEFEKPVTVEIQYSNEDLEGGYILGERHAVRFPKVAEESLAIYRYSDEDGIWWPVEGSELDASTHTVFVRVDSLNGIYGVAAHAAEESAEPTPSPIAPMPMWGWIALAALSVGLIVSLLLTPSIVPVID